MSNITPKYEHVLFSVVIKRQETSKNPRVIKVEMLPNKQSTLQRDSAGTT